MRRFVYEDIARLEVIDRWNPQTKIKKCIQDSLEHLFTVAIPVSGDILQESVHVHEGWANVLGAHWILNHDFLGNLRIVGVRLQHSNDLASEWRVV